MCGNSPSSVGEPPRMFFDRNGLLSWEYRSQAFMTVGHII